MKRLGAAVIGCGSWGRNHARVYSDIKNVKLEAVADTLEKNARDIGEKHRVSWSTEPDTVIQSPNIDLVSICTPTVTHYELALRAIESGKHVLVEKPMTNTLEEAKELIKAAQRNNVKLTVGFVERFNTAVEEALNLIRAGEIGDVILAHTRRLSRRPLRIGDVGVIKDLAIHDIDITNQLFPGMPDSVYAIAGNIAHQFEDYANISIRHPKNRTAFIETNWLTPRKTRTLTVTGSEGIINVEYITQELTIENYQSVRQPLLNPQEPLQRELESFVQAILDDKTPAVTGEDGLKALAICEAALTSVKLGQPVEPKIN